MFAPHTKTARDLLLSDVTDVTDVTTRVQPSSGAPSSHAAAVTPRKIQASQDVTEKKGCCRSRMYLVYQGSPKVSEVDHES
jgi:hypothetical protein